MIAWLAVQVARILNWALGPPDLEEPSRFAGMSNEELDEELRRVRLEAENGDAPEGKRRAAG